MKLRVQHRSFMTCGLDGRLGLSESSPMVPHIPNSFHLSLVPVDRMAFFGIMPTTTLNSSLQVSDEPAKRVEFAQHWITRGFSAVENLLEGTSGKYCVGDGVSVADVCLVPQISAAERFNVPLQAYPNIARINAGLNKLDAFIQARMDNQPDCPEELKKKA